jgi:hypothetical protein
MFDLSMAAVTELKGEGFSCKAMLFGRWRLLWGFFVEAANLMKLWI